MHVGQKSRCAPLACPDSILRYLFTLNSTTPQMRTSRPTPLVTLKLSPRNITAATTILSATHTQLQGLGSCISWW